VDFNVSLRHAGFAAALALCQEHASAQGAGPRDFSQYHPVAHAVRIAASEAPAIDGDISDPVWRKAEIIDKFFQTEPDEGTPASERTEVRILYDEDNIYVAIFAADGKAPAARVKQRDGDFGGDDFVRIYLDPGRTRRDAYIFDINPLGARADGLLQNNDRTLLEWNPIWKARARISAHGWSAEMAIPFRSIAYAEGSEWGFDVFRIIRRRNEHVRWASISKVLSSGNVSREGTLTGINGVRKGLGLDVQAFALTRYYKNWDGPKDTGVSFRPSTNIFYKVTPSLTATLTANTDFSDAPLDQRKVNISRFSLFYPERRDFFLQDAAAFEFGGLALSVNQDPNGLPFVSRSIGIVDDRAVNILGGAKLSGEYGGIGIGGLSVRTAGSGGIHEQSLSVARASVPVLAESKLGMIFTNGDPTGTTHNSVAGADFQFRRSDLFGDKILNGDAYYERSFSNVHGDDASFGLNLNFPNEPWNSYFRFKQVGANFDPRLGFVSRPAIRDYQGNLTRRQRTDGGTLRWWETGGWFEVATGLDDDMQTKSYGAWFGADTQAGDYLLIEGWTDYEKVDAPFGLPHGRIVPAGEYEFITGHARAELIQNRPLYGTVDVQYGGFYGGTLLQTDTTIGTRPDESLQLSLRHIMQQIHLPSGNVAIQIASFDGAVNFTPDMLMRAQLQYDNISHDFELSLRYRWEFEPGAELLVVLGEDATLRAADYRSHASKFSVRLGKTFRF
jgi:hypothetical protein